MSLADIYNELIALAYSLDDHVTASDVVAKLHELIEDISESGLWS